VSRCELGHYAATLTTRKIKIWNICLLLCCRIGSSYCDN